MASVRPDLEIESLVERVRSGVVKEVILALSSTMEGDTTNFYIFRKLCGFEVKLTVIARGISIGDELQYTDEVNAGALDCEPDCLYWNNVIKNKHGKRIEAPLVVSNVSNMCWPGWASPCWVLLYEIDFLPQGALVEDAQADYVMQVTGILLAVGLIFFLRLFSLSLTPLCTSVIFAAGLDQLPPLE